MTTSSPRSAEQVADLLTDILTRRGSESYLGEAVTMSEHMLQTAMQAEEAGEPDEIIVAALLHDIGHYTGEFGDDYLERGIDNRHQVAGYEILKDWFPSEVSAVTRWHVDAKRYLCAVDRDYYSSLSDSSVTSLELQGGPMQKAAMEEFEEVEGFEPALRVRRYDDAAKVPDLPTPPMDHYLAIVRRVLMGHNPAQDPETA